MVIKCTYLSSSKNKNTLVSIIADDPSEQIDATSNDDKSDSEGEDFDVFNQNFGSDDLDP